MSTSPPGYSKLLIHERILADKGATEWDATMDMGMLMFHGSQERSKQQWRQLLEQAGFRVETFWMAPFDGEGIVEAVIDG